MKDKIKNYEVKLNKQKQNSQQLGILGECNPDFDFPTPLIDYDEEEKKETQQIVESQIDQKLSSTKEDKKTEDSTQHQNNNSNKKQMPVSKQTKIDYAQTVLDLQEKLSRATAVRETETQLSTKNLVKSQQEDSNQTASISSDSSKNLVKPGLGKFAWSTCNFKT